MIDRTQTDDDCMMYDPSTDMHSSNSKSALTTKQKSASDHTLIPSTEIGHRYTALPVRLITSLQNNHSSLGIDTCRSLALITWLASCVACGKDSVVHPWRAAVVKTSIREICDTLALTQFRARSTLKILKELGHIDIDRSQRGSLSIALLWPLTALADDPAPARSLNQQCSAPKYPSDAGNKELITSTQAVEAKHLTHDQIHDVYQAYTRSKPDDAPFVKISQLWRESGKPPRKEFMRWLELAAKHKIVELSQHNTDARFLQSPQSVDATAPSITNATPTQRTTTRRIKLDARMQIVVDTIQMMFEEAKHGNRTQGLCLKTLHQRLTQDHGWNDELIDTLLTHLTQHGLLRSSGYKRKRKVHLIPVKTEPRPRTKRKPLPIPSLPVLSPETIRRSMPKDFAPPQTQSPKEELEPNQLHLPLACSTQPSCLSKPHNDDRVIESTAPTQPQTAEHSTTKPRAEKAPRKVATRTRTEEHPRTSQMSIQTLVSDRDIDAPTDITAGTDTLSSERATNAYQSLKGSQGRSVDISDLWRQAGRPQRDHFVDWVVAEVEAERAVLAGRGARVRLGKGDDTVFTYKGTHWGLIRLIEPSPALDLSHPSNAQPHA